MTSGKVATTLGYERRNNPALRFQDRDAFVRFMNDGQPARPANVKNIVAINRGTLPLTMDLPKAPALDVRAFAELAAQGHIVIDTRSSAAFGAGHVPHAYHIHLSSPEFEQRVGWVTPTDKPMLLVLEKDDDAPRALRALAFLGLDRRVKGHLAGGMNAWRGDGRPLVMVPQTTVQELQERRSRGNPITVLDVREQDEWQAGHIEGARLMSYRRLAELLDELPFSHDDPVAVICRSGARSSTASSVLQMHGYTGVQNVAGGMQAWKAAKLPTVGVA